MKRLILLMSLVLLATLVPVNQASAFNWLRLRLRARTQTPQRVMAAGVQRSALAKSAAYSRSQPARRTNAHTAVRKYRSEDERRVAELGPERARMCYPKYDDTEPYPACRAWKRDEDDVWGWDWSEMNCPWKQLRHPLKYDYD